MQMTKIERPALGLLSLVGKRGTLTARPTTTTTASDSRGTLTYRALPFIAGTMALCVTSINQHAVKHAAKQVGRLNASDWKRNIRRSRKPRVANG
jgi:hypothetical protein